MTADLAPQALVWLDEAGTVTSLNQAAAALIGSAPADLLGRPGSLLGGGLGRALGHPGKATPLVEWSKQDEGWLARLTGTAPPVIKSIELDLAREILLHSPSPERAMEVLVGALSALAEGRPWGLWLARSGGLVWAAGEGGELPAVISAASLVVRLGRPVSLGAGEGLAAVEDWPTDQASSAWPILAGGMLAGVAAFGGGEVLPEKVGEQAAALARCVLAARPSS